MSIIQQNSRISHHTTTTGETFSVPTQEDFTLKGTQSWTVNDLALSEIGVDEFNNKAFIRIGAQINEISFGGGTGGAGSLSDTLAIGNNTGTNNITIDTDQQIQGPSYSHIQLGTTGNETRIRLDSTRVDPTGSFGEFNSYVNVEPTETRMNSEDQIIGYEARLLVASTGTTGATGVSICKMYAQDNNTLDNASIYTYFDTHSSGNITMKVETSGTNVNYFRMSDGMNVISSTDYIELSSNDVFINVNDSSLTMDHGGSNTLIASNVMKIQGDINDTAPSITLQNNQISTEMLGGSMSVISTNINSCITISKGGTLTTTSTGTQSVLTIYGIEIAQDVINIEGYLIGNCLTTSTGASVKFRAIFTNYGGLVLQNCTYDTLGNWTNMTGSPDDLINVYTDGTDVFINALPASSDSTVWKAYADIKISN